MKDLKKHILFLSITFVAVLIFLEILFQIMAMGFTSVNNILSPNYKPKIIPNTIKDEKLGYRPNPKHPEHDSWGFRNEKVPDQADIVCLGDSQTYGTSIPANKSWSQQLELMCNCKTYNMAYGGYGPTHSLILFKEAVSLRPRLIIEAFYSGNDLFDSYKFVYIMNKLAEFKTKDSILLDSIKKAESLESIVHRVSRMFKMEEAASDKTEHSSSKKEPTESRIKACSVRSFLSNYSKSYGLVRALKRILVPDKKSKHKSPTWEEAKKTAERNSKYCQIFSNDQVKTVFTPEYRLSVLDFQDIRIKEGFRISLDVIRRMNILAKSKDIEFIVLLIPTKEYVFSEMVLQKRINNSKSYNSLVDNEKYLWKETKSFFNENKINFIDSLPALRRALQEGNQPYFIYFDGHPNEIGHKTIAELIMSKLEL